MLPDQRKIIKQYIVETAVKSDAVAHGGFPHERLHQDPLPRFHLRDKSSELSTAFNYRKIFLACPNTV